MAVIAGWSNLLVTEVGERVVENDYVKQLANANTVNGQSQDLRAP